MHLPGRSNVFFCRAIKIRLLPLYYGVMKLESVKLAHEEINSVINILSSRGHVDVFHL